MGGAAAGVAPTARRRLLSQRRLDPTRVAALIPCHVDPPSAELVTRVLDHVGRLVIIDDGLSAPARAVLADRAGRPEMDVISTDGNRGKGHALATGLGALLARQRPPEAVLVLDADGQHPPEYIPAFLAAAVDADLVVGDRFGELARMPPERRLANWLASRILRLTTKKSVRDTQCGMRLLRGRALHDVPFAGGGYEAEACHLKRCLVAGVPVAWVAIPAIYEGAPSSFRNARDTIRVAAALLR